MADYPTAEDVPIDDGMPGFEDTGKPTDITLLRAVAKEFGTLIPHCMNCDHPMPANEKGEYFCRRSACKQRREKRLMVRNVHPC